MSKKSLIPFNIRNKVACFKRDWKNKNIKEIKEKILMMKIKLIILEKLI